MRLCKKKGICSACILLIALYFTLVLAGCSKNVNTEKKNDKLNIITTIFPYYDFVRQIAGDKVNLKLIVPAGMDTHSFEPTVKDMINLQKADIVIYNGGEMEEWVDEILEATSNSDIIAEKMMDYVDVIAEETVEGMEKEHHESDNDADETPEYDEHIWTSPVNASKIVLKISDILSAADKKNSKIYDKNAKAYSKKLDKLDNEFRKIVNLSQRNFLVFADRFPLKYFTDEYNLNYSAAFSGCSSETEPSANTIAFLINKVKDENIHVILKIELTSTKIADVIAEETNAEIETFYTCHNVTKRQFNDGITYYDLMKENTNILKKAL